MGGPPTSPPDEPHGSIIERFKGTPWETPGPPATAPSGGRTSQLLIGLGIVGLVAAGAVALALLPPPGPTPAPSHIIYTPPPTPGPSELLRAAFWEEVAASTLSYHVTIVVTAPRVTQRLAFDVYAEDLDGTADVAATGLLPLTHFTLLRSGGVLYAKVGAEKQWSEALAATEFPGLAVRPFLSLEDPRQLTDGGTVELGGQTLHRLVSTDLYRPGFTRVFPFSIGFAPSAQIALVLLVTEVGVPVEARFTMHIPADPANGTGAADAAATYQFSKVGQVGPIPTPNL